MYHSDFTRFSEIFSLFFLGSSYHFDAFLSHADDDMEFVKHLLKELESLKPPLRVCITERDLLAGGAEHFDTAALIEHRYFMTAYTILTSCQNWS